MNSIYTHKMQIKYVAYCLSENTIFFQNLNWPVWAQSHLLEHLELDLWPSAGVINIIRLFSIHTLRKSNSHIIK